MFYFLFYTIYGLAVLIDASKPNQGKYLLMMSPQHLFGNGTSIDFDYKLKDNAYLIFSPQFYYNEKGIQNGLLYTDCNRISGYGLGISRKQFFSTDAPFYFSCGVAFHHFNMNKDILNKPTDISINRISGSYQFGYQAALGDHLYFDFYAGMALRESSSNTVIKINKTAVDYGYSGVMFISGVRVGIGF